VTAARLSALTLNAIKDRNDLDTTAVEDVIWGNVTQVGEQGGCLARTAVLASDFDERVPGLSINRFCASGLEAVNLAANQVRAGAGQAYVAGGVEMMGRVPMGSDGAAIAVDPAIAMSNYFVPRASRPTSSPRNSASPAIRPTRWRWNPSAAPQRRPGRRAASPAPSSPCATGTACRSSTA
jgi:acetyl-CoA acetyltransferase